MKALSAILMIDAIWEVARMKGKKSQERCSEHIGELHRIPKLPSCPNHEAQVLRRLRRPRRALRNGHSGCDNDLRSISILHSTSIHPIAIGMPRTALLGAQKNPHLDMRAHPHSPTLAPISASNFFWLTLERLSCVMTYHLLKSCGKAVIESTL